MTGNCLTLLGSLDETLSGQHQPRISYFDCGTYCIASSPTHEVPVLISSPCGRDQERVVSCLTAAPISSSRENTHILSDPSPNLGIPYPHSAANQEQIYSYLAFVGLVAIVCTSLSVVALAALGKNVTGSINWDGRSNVHLEAKQPEK